MKEKYRVSFYNMLLVTKNNFWQKELNIDAYIHRFYFQRLELGRYNEIEHNRMVEKHFRQTR